MHNNTRYFTDRVGSGVRRSTFYDTGSVETGILPKFAPSPLQIVVNTPATARTGTPVVRSQTPIKLPEATGVGGTQIGVVTLFNQEELINEGNDTRSLDAFRTGRNVKNYKQDSKPKYLRHCYINI